jgi:hypothetical protein
MRYLRFRSTGMDAVRQCITAFLATIPSMMESIEMLIPMMPIPIVHEVRTKTFRIIGYRYSAAPVHDTCRRTRRGRDTLRNSRNPERGRQCK